MGSITGSNNVSIYIGEDGHLVYPCRCGLSHIGEYAEYDFEQHNCLHEVDLIKLGNEQVVCPDCGMSWRIENENPPYGEAK